MELNNNKTAPIVQEMDKNQLSLDLMHRMRLTGMATAFEESLTTTIADTMTPDAFLSWLLSREWDYRSAAAIERLIKSGLMVKCTPERGQKCSLFHLMVKCTPIIVELPSVYRGCKPLICFQ